MIRDHLVIAILLIVFGGVFAETAEAGPIRWFGSKIGNVACAAGQFVANGPQRAQKRRANRQAARGARGGCANGACSP